VNNIKETAFLVQVIKHNLQLKLKTIDFLHVLSCTNIGGSYQMNPDFYKEE
jgi:hypothetical protein